VLQITDIEEEDRLFKGNVVLLGSVPYLSKYDFNQVLTFEFLGFSGVSKSIELREIEGKGVRCGTYINIVPKNVLLE